MPELRRDLATIIKRVNPVVVRKRDTVCAGAVHSIEALANIKLTRVAITIVFDYCLDAIPAIANMVIHDFQDL